MNSASTDSTDHRSEIFRDKCPSVADVYCVRNMDRLFSLSLFSKQCSITTLYIRSIHIGLGIISNFEL